MRSFLVLAVARHDLAALIDAAAKENEERAYRLIEASEQALRTIAEAPKQGAPVSVAGVAGEVWCRLLPGFPKIVVYYRTLPEGTMVLRVLRGGRIPGWRLRMALESEGNE